MKELLESEHKILYADQPFVDKSGTVHLPIDEAMKIIEQRGLPVKPAGAAVTQKAAPLAKAAAAPGAQ